MRWEEESRTLPVSEKSPPHKDKLSGGQLWTTGLLSSITQQGKKTKPKTIL